MHVLHHNSAASNSSGAKERMERDGQEEEIFLGKKKKVARAHAKRITAEVNIIMWKQELLGRKMKRDGSLNQRERK